MLKPASTISPELNVFRDPASVAVVGASADPAKWGHWLAKGALAGRHRRDVYLVNHAGRPVLGTQTYANLSELPVAPELVAVCVPAAHVGAVVDEALELGARGLLGITAAVADEGDIGIRVRAAGARMIGMNSLGIYDASAELHLAWGNFVSGSIAVISQSGQLGSEIAKLAAQAGLGVSRFVSIGNQTDVGAAEVLSALIDDEATQIVALYLEGFTNGRTIIETIAALRAAGKHTLLLTVGGSDASSRLARSHTGSMTSSTAMVDAAARAAGAVRVKTPAELVDVAQLLLGSGTPRGRRVAVVGDSGGQTGIAADVAADAGLEVPEFSDTLRTELGLLLPPAAANANPVDLAGAGEQDLKVYARVVEILLNSNEVDAVALTGYFGLYGEDTPALTDQESGVAAALGATAQQCGKPLVVHTMARSNVVTEVLNQHGVAVYSTIENALRAVHYAQELTRSPRPLTSAPRASDVPVAAGYPAARELLSDRGVRFPAGAIVGSPSDLESVAAQLSPPYVLKAGWLEHKSEMGGVRIGLADSTELSAALSDMRERLGDGQYVVEELDDRPNVVEMLVGARRDPDLGAVVLVGAGGTEAELYRDVTVELAPVDTDTALAMIDRLTCAALLRGWRGRPAVDTASLAQIVVTVSELAAAHTDIAEIDINPVRVGIDSAIAVDALVIPADTTNAP
ncbi:acid--CoA ligase [Mycobacterium sp. CBMA 234]|uniref:acetate--CoA ligase family protein n=1 Tax=Mycolicibacterium sp. CBMA 234 TaxID=1918495 RepID=UPI0012DF133C|nr:acetate--CoA ligase family protein [Mycolicibacterium sp. CBMA 234]MUL68216.1 acid--CoA ligase [Mycolicibacterium sp. CBMA 234]